MKIDFQEIANIKDTKKYEIKYEINTPIFMNNYLFHYYLMEKYQ